MKNILILLVLLLCSHNGCAQKVKEWLRQKKTQKQYLIEQIAHLKLYLELTEKGYKIAKEGLTTISSIKDGEFKLHKNRFDSLCIVKPQIRKLDINQQTLLNFRYMLFIYWGLPEFFAENTGLSSNEKTLVKSVLEKVIAEGIAVMDELSGLTEDGVFCMSDDARVTRLTVLYNRSEQNYTFARQVSAQAALLSAQRKSEQQDFENRRVWHGIN
jgi:hypothetical protein